MSKLHTEDKIGIGCMTIIILFNLGWISLLIWAIISLVNWVTSK